jgi:hypothetical protein
VVISKKAIAAVLVLLICSFLIPLAEAQPEPPDVDTLGPVVGLSQAGGGVVILSPRNSTAYATPVQLVFGVEAIGMFGQFGNVGVSVDGGVINSVTDFIRKSVVQIGPEWYRHRTTVLSSITLQDLSLGAHSVTVYFGWQYLGIPENPSLERYVVFSYATVDFMVVNADAPDVGDTESDIAIYCKPEITISSPSDNSLSTVPLSLNFTVIYRHPLVSNAAVHYSIDGQENIPVVSSAGSSTRSGERMVTPYSLEIGDLSDGLHNFTVSARVSYFHYGSSSVSSSVQFTIDTLPPEISVLTLANKTYYLNTIPLDFTVSKPVSQIAYSLNGEANITIAGNTTLLDLPYGAHNITFYATDLAGNTGASETVYFTVSKPFPTAVLASSVIIIVVAGLAVLVYFARFRKQGEHMGDKA